jgi:hypothetical protein
MKSATRQQVVKPHAFYQRDRAIERGCGFLPRIDALDEGSIYGIIRFAPQLNRFRNRNACSLRKGVKDSSTGMGRNGSDLLRELLPA